MKALELLILAREAISEALSISGNDFTFYGVTIPTEGDMAKMRISIKSGDGTKVRTYKIEVDFEVEH